MTRLALAASLGLVAAVVAGCTDDHPSSEDSGSCYNGLECRTIEVPQTHGAAGAGTSGGATIGLKVIIGRAPNASGKSPIVYLEGGPGGTVANVAQSGFVQAAAKGLGRDFVLLEQRGNTLSRPALDCGLNDNAEPSPETIQSCTAGYTSQGYALGAFNTIENAHDIEDVRVALGVKKVILWGGSYGGMLAQTAARLHPDALAGILLESSAMSGRPYRPFDQQKAQPQKLTDFLAWYTKACAASQQCAAAMPSFDAAKELAAFQERVKTRPFTLTANVVIDSPDIAKYLALITMYYIPNAALVLRMMYYANHEQQSVFDQIKVGSENASDYIARIIAFASVNRSSNFVYDCYDLTRNWTPSGLSQAIADSIPLEDQESLRGQSDAQEKACAALPEPSVPPSELIVSTTTNVPTLFMHGGLDWPTPLEIVESQRAQYSRAQLVTVPCAGHGIQQVVPQCFGALASTFFDQADDGSFAGTLDATCATTYCDSSHDESLFVEMGP